MDGASRGGDPQALRNLGFASAFLCFEIGGPCSDRLANSDLCGVRTRQTDSLSIIDAQTIHITKYERSWFARAVSTSLLISGRRSATTPQCGKCNGELVDDAGRKSLVRLPFHCTDAFHLVLYENVMAATMQLRLPLSNILRTLQSLSSLIPFAFNMQIHAFWRR